MLLTNFISRFFLFLFVLCIHSITFAVDEKEWTFLLFLNGHNNLSSFGDMNLKDMEKSGSTDRVNIVVEWGKMDSDLTHRLLVQKSTDPTRVTSPVIMSFKDRDMGDYKNFVDFVKWGIDQFPAKHYFVAVWNHGSGWHFQSTKLMNKLNSNLIGSKQIDSNLMGSNQVGVNDISFDDKTGNFISTEQLGIAMGEIKNYLGRKIDIYGSDACLMQMLEVVGEMKDSVSYFVGSQETEPGEGWPYEQFMKKWTEEPLRSPAEVSVLLSKEYLAAYSGGAYGTTDVTFSALDVSFFDAVVASNQVVSNYLKNIDTNLISNITNSLKTVRSFYFDDYKDYGDFLKTLIELKVSDDNSIFEKARSDMNSLVLTVDSSAEYSKATGVSIWLPSASQSFYMERYKGLEFDKLTGWSSFLERLHK